MIKKLIMYLVAGLGNPGPKFKNTRHNTGFYTVEKIAGAGGWKKSKKGNYLYKKKKLASRNILFVKPQTFMNDSGVSLRSTQGRFGLEMENIIVIHDDVNLELGNIKISRSKSAGGHKGVSSIIKELGSNEFIRIRIGISTPGQKQALSQFVLEEFQSQEKKIIEQDIARVEEALRLIVEKGVDRAMTTINSSFSQG